MKYSTLTLLLLALLAGCGSSSPSDPEDGGTTDADAGGSSEDGGEDAGDPDEDGGDEDAGDDEDAGEDSGSGPDDGGGTDDAGEDAGADADTDAGTILTCEDEAIECGIIEDDGQGNELDCREADGNPTGTEKSCDTSYQQCNDDTNKCVCLVEEPETCGMDQVECGIANTCEPGGEVCDVCSGLSGENWQCNEVTRKCECPASSEAEACGERQCGTVSNGCDGTYDCGTCASEARTCSDEGACACKPPTDEYRTTACGGAICGKVTVDGCEFYCDQPETGDPTGAACDDECASGGSCAPGENCSCPGDEVCGSGTTCCTPSTAEALCGAAGVECGDEVTDPCTGQTYTCDLCGDGLGCAPVEFVEGATEVRRTCIDETQAQLVGKYLVRTHAFTGALAGSINKAETVSIVTITRKGDGSLELFDQGCVATTTDGEENGQRSTSVGYWRIPPVTVALSTAAGDPTTWLRDATPVGLATGFQPEQPDFCDCPDDTSCAPTPSDGDPQIEGSGSQKPWLDDGEGGPGTCTCVPNSETCATSELDTACMPDQVGSRSDPTDCRLHDTDKDGLAGVTLDFTGTLSADVAITSIANIIWQGEVRPDGAHVGYQSQPEGIDRTVQSCDGSFLLCLGARTTAPEGCADLYSRLYFVKLQGADQNITCGAFYEDGFSMDEDVVTDREQIEQAFINNKFAAIGPACASNAECPQGMVCRNPEGSGGVCWPMTTPGACTPDDPATEETNEDSCAGATSGGEWVCRARDRACWPVTCD